MTQLWVDKLQHVRQAIIWSIASLVLIESLVTNFCEILLKLLKFWIHTNAFEKSSVRYRTFCFGLNVVRLYKGQWVAFKNDRDSDWSYDVIVHYSWGYSESAFRLSNHINCSTIRLKFKSHKPLTVSQPLGMGWFVVSSKKSHKGLVSHLHCI